MSLYYGSFPNFGFIRSDVPENLLDNLTTEINDARLNPREFNNSLAGNIKNQFLLEKNKDNLLNFLSPICKNYTQVWDAKKTTRSLKSEDLKISNYWVNIQKKYEFNPMHSHDGIFSFVIWIKIPYKISDEVSLDLSNKSNTPRAGMFSFIYTNIFGEIREAEIPVDEYFQGQCFIFPSSLQHTVYPFYTSDQERISVSGNLI